MAKFKIYKLIKDDRVVYIGRIGYHHYLCRRAAKHRYDKKDFDSYELIELTDDPTREAYWIKYYDTYNNGLNLTEDGLHCINKTESHMKEMSRLSNIARRKKTIISKGDIILTFNSVKDASEYIGCGERGVSNIARGKGNTIYGWKVKYIEVNSNGKEI